MPNLNLQVAITLSDDEAVAVADALGCPVNQLQARLQLYAPAAVREYVEMFGGQALQSVTDVRDRRLLAILLTLPEFPTDEMVARLFNLTASSARALLRTTVSRHRNRLKGAIETAAKAFLAACTQNQAGGDWEVRYPSAVVVDVLNAQLAAAQNPRTPIERKRGTFDTYTVSNGAKNELDGLYP